MFVNKTKISLLLKGKRNVQIFDSNAGQHFNKMFVHNIFFGVQIILTKLQGVYLVQHLGENWVNKIMKIGWSAFT